MRVVKSDPFNAEVPLDRLEEDITQPSNFFVRNHFAMPTLEIRKHRLVVRGAVERDLKLTVDDLRTMDTRTVTATLECAGNGRTGLAPVPAGEPWHFGAVGTAHWTGVPLGTVLESAHVRTDAVEILAVGADRGPPLDDADGTGEIRFSRSLPLTKATDPDTLLAVEMNGQLLPREHGGPVRLIVPGWYGMASVKWLERIEALTEPHRGPFQVDRYAYRYADDPRAESVTTMRVRSLIVSPQERGIVRQGPVRIRGKAWSGEGKAVSVEVTVDNTGWNPATLLPAPSPYAWCAWEFVWDAAKLGPHILRSRATDERGNRQPELGRWNRHGYGNNAVQAVAVTVRATKGR